MPDNTINKIVNLSPTVIVLFSKVHTAKYDSQAIAIIQFGIVSFK